MLSTVLNPEISVLTKCEEKGYTILHCETFQRKKKVPAGILTIKWATVSKATSLYNRQTKENLTLLHAINIPVDPDKYWFKFGGERLAFTLIYPQIPADWRYFDFTNSPNSVTKIPAGHVVTGWLVRNIKRNETGIYRLTLD